jgi:hypothetical protein
MRSCWLHCYASAIVPLEYDADLQSPMDDPLLQRDKLDMQSGEFVFIVLALQLSGHSDRLR